MSVEFVDNSIRIKAALKEAAIAGLHDAGSIIKSQTQENSRVATGQTKGAWQYVVDEDEMSATIGNPLENAVWEEFGTGEFSLNDDGRKGGWVYVDQKGKGHFTYGKTPVRMLHNAFVTKRETVIKAIERQIKDRMN